MQQSPSIKLCTRTWERDSHGLYDYESDNIFSNEFLVTQNGFLYRNRENCLTSFRTESSQTFEQLLAKVSIENNLLKLSKEVKKNLPINNETLKGLQEQIWYVVKQNRIPKQYSNRFYSNYEYELKINDIVKLGRIKFIVKEMNIFGQEVKSSEQIFIPYEQNNEIISKEDVCRICYNKEATEQNPMISVCKCKGSMNLHLECLKSWLKMKMIEKEMTQKPGVTYTFKKFNCEICNEPYPFAVKVKDKCYNLFDYSVPEGQNYIILQSLNSVKENAYPLSIHVLMFIDNGDYFSIGRGHESDIRISDISVSRLHAKIFMRDNKFYMEDVGSKFGTLVLAKEPVEMREKYLFQIGKTMLFSERESNDSSFKKFLDAIKNEDSKKNSQPGIFDDEKQYNSS